ncbi:4-hydroxyphenylacetate 3-monooxygenase, reductase component [Morganella psychrotolerans]|uniref:4-hydroxyphenylacetate 3-monooxygenase, reductase component n=1 Tax=Morganella psychrotolerans TaxID=368603 RepID=UPI0039B10DAA
MSFDNSRCLQFRDAMANLSAAVNIVTTDGEAGRAGLTATAVCSVTDNPPTLLVCINRSSALSEVFKTNGRLCVNVLTHTHQALACDFAGMTGLSMDARFSGDNWQSGQLGQPCLNNSLASLEGTVTQVQEIGTHNVFMVEIENVDVRDRGHGLIYFKRDFRVIETSETLSSAVA